MEWPPLGDYWVGLGPVGIVVWLVSALIEWLRSGVAYVAGLLDSALPEAPALVVDACGQVQQATAFLSSGPLGFFPWVALGIGILSYLGIVIAAFVAKFAMRALSLYTGGGGSG